MSLMNDIIDAVRRHARVRERLVPGAKPLSSWGVESTGLMELVALVEEYLAAKDAHVAEVEQYCMHDVCEPYDYAAHLQRVLQIGRRIRAAEASLRAAVAR